MSRSRKKTPIVGNTCIESDKWFKAKAHRQERAAIRCALSVGEEPANEAKRFGDPHASGKDGKHYWPDARAYRK